MVACCVPPQIPSTRRASRQTRRVFSFIERCPHGLAGSFELLAIRFVVQESIGLSCKERVKLPGLRFGHSPPQQVPHSGKPRDHAANHAVPL